jgi:dTDP-4-amino-4,6-dideoxygalactose transaminase
MTLENSHINVTQPFLPPLNEFVPYLEQIWDSKILTNNGPFHHQLEQALCEHLGVKHLSLFANGTLALLTALQALEITGEVITTPFSFIATSHSLLWNGITPVFVDIEPHSLNLDHRKIEAAITSKTSAILPVHCYGNPCEVDAIQAIADKYKLRVIYDAAHAFGVKCHCGSLLLHGDVSVLSFHATKVFNTFEGGAVVCPDLKTKLRLDTLKNFGILDEVSVIGTGINGKMSELNSALGLLQLKHINHAIDRRKEIYDLYQHELQHVTGISSILVDSHIFPNYAYYPILVEPDFPIGRDALYNKLKSHSIYSRRYFYPLITDFPMYSGFPSATRSNLPVAASSAERIICLPIYPSLTDSEVKRILAVLIGC